MKRIIICLSLVFFVILMEVSAFTPTIVGRVPIPGHGSWGPAQTVVDSRGIAWVVSEEGDSLTGFYYSDPTNVVVVGILCGAGAPNYLDKPICLATYDGKLVFLCYRQDGVHSSYLGWTSGVFIEGDTLFVTSQLKDALTSWDISDPSNAVELGYLSCPILDGALRVVVRNKLAYIVSFDAHSLVIADVADPADLYIVSWVDGLANHMGWPQSVVISDDGKYAYVMAWASYSATRVDISDSQDPFVVDWVGNIGGPSIAAISGRYVLVPASTSKEVVIIQVDETPSGVENWMDYQ